LRIANPAPTPVTCGQRTARPPATIAKRPIGHSRWKAMRPALSVGREVDVRAADSAFPLASPERREPPSEIPPMAAISHHTPEK